MQFVWAFTLVLWIREQGPRSTRSQAKLWPHWEGWERLLLSSPFRFFLPLRSANSHWYSGFSGCTSAVQMWLQHGYKQCQVTDFWSAPINAAFSPLKFHYSVNLKCPPSDVAVWGEASLAGRVWSLQMGHGKSSQLLSSRVALSLLCWHGHSCHPNLSPLRATTQDGLRHSPSVRKRGPLLSCLPQAFCHSRTKVTNTNSNFIYYTPTFICGRQLLTS